jgi:hypothetical protein
MDVPLLHISALHHDNVLTSQQHKSLGPTPCDVVRLNAIGGVGSFRGSGIPLLKGALEAVCAVFPRHEMVALEPKLKPATIGPNPTDCQSTRGTRHGRLPGSPSSCQLIFWPSRYSTLRTSLNSTLDPTTRSVLIEILVVNYWPPATTHASKACMTQEGESSNERDNESTLYL